MIISYSITFLVSHLQDYQMKLLHHLHVAHVGQEPKRFLSEREGRIMKRNKETKKVKKRGKKEKNSGAADCIC